MHAFAFIDAENVRNSVEYKGYADLNYEKLYDWLINKKNVVRIYLYVGIEAGDNEKDLKFTKLQQLGYHVYKKRVMTYFQKPIIVKVSCKNCGNKIIEKIPRYKKQKANCDADLTLDIINCGVRKKYLASKHFMKKELLNFEIFMNCLMPMEKKISIMK